MQLFYYPTLTENDEIFNLNKEESAHIIRVNRKTEGDKISITNGLGFIFITEIKTASASKCELKIVQVIPHNPQSYRLHLAVAPTKMNERFEWFLEKATEIGIQEITPIICDNSERRTINLPRYQKIIESAMKQSQKAFLPILNEPIAFSNFVKKDFSAQKFIAHCDSEFEKISLKKKIQPAQDCLILIGPEGDFSKKEISMATQNLFEGISLGSTRLRTETAAVIACHSVVYANEN